jgi:hypothetical protein
MPDAKPPIKLPIPPGVDGFTDPSDPRYYGHSRFQVRLWHGMTTWAWFRFLRGHMRDVSRDRFGLALSVTLVSLINSFFALTEKLFYSHKLAKVKLRDDPVLIIGFQRSGTTFLNELLACDPRFGFPDNIHCFQPEAFLVTEKTLRPLSKLGAPNKRPMDDIDASPDAPQEDEIALLLSGIPSPYKGIAFPSEVGRYRSTLEEEHNDPRKTAAWTKGWLRFLTKVQFATGGKRLLLKSPTHTVRIRRILSVFPKARFIHITRSPYKIFHSNLKLGFALTATQGLQRQTFDLENIVEELLSGFALFHEAYEAQKPDIPPEQLVTVVYEELVKDPVGQMRRIYDALDLGDFGPVEAPLQAYLDARTNYKTNTYAEDPEMIRRINDRWGLYFETYGYRITDPDAAAPQETPNHG